MTGHRVKASPCPSCDQVLDGAADLDGDALPSPGDYTVCAYCLAVAVFDDELVLREPTPPERVRAMLEPSVAAAQNMLRINGFGRGRRG